MPIFCKFLLSLSSQLSDRPVVTDRLPGQVTQIDRSHSYWPQYIDWPDHRYTQVTTTWSHLFFTWTILQLGKLPPNISFLFFLSSSMWISVASSPGIFSTSKVWKATVTFYTISLLSILVCKITSCTWTAMESFKIYIFVYWICKVNKAWFWKHGWVKEEKLELKLSKKICIVCPYPPSTINQPLDYFLPCADQTT